MERESSPYGIRSCTTMASVASNVVVVAPPMHEEERPGSPNSYDEGMQWSKDFYLLDVLDAESDCSCVCSSSSCASCVRYYRSMAATFKFNLGKLEESRGHMKEALDLYRECRKLDEGQLRVDTLFSMAYVQYCLNEHVGSKVTYDALLREEGLTPLETAALHNGLGVIHYYLSSGIESESSDSADAHLKYSLRLRRRHCVPKNCTCIATTLNNLGRVQFHRGEFDASLVAYEEALRIRRLLLGSGHLDVGATLFNAGQAEHQRNNPSRALQLYRDFLRICLGRLGSHHRDVAIVTTCIAQVYHEHQEYEHAMKLYVEALNIGKTALGEHHSEVATTWNKIGNCWYEQAEWDEALRAYEAGLAIEERILERDNPNILVTLQNIAEIHRNRAANADGEEARSEYRSALKRYARMKELQTELYGSNSPEVATTLKWMGAVYFCLNDANKALECMQLTKSIQLEVYGKDSIHLASTLSQIAVVLFRNFMHEMALSVLHESNRIHTLHHNRRLRLDEDIEDSSSVHKEMVSNQFFIASIYLERGDHTQALRYLYATLKLELSLYGEDSGDVGMTRFKLGQVQEELGQLDAALREFKEVLRIERLTLGDGHVSVAQTLNAMGNIYLRRHDIPQMMKAYSGALRIFQRNRLSPDALRVKNGHLYAFDTEYPGAAGAA